METATTSPDIKPENSPESKREDIAHFVILATPLVFVEGNDE